MRYADRDGRERAALALTAAYASSGRPTVEHFVPPTSAYRKSVPTTASSNRRRPMSARSRGSDTLALQRCSSRISSARGGRSEWMGNEPNEFALEFRRRREDIARRRRRVMTTGHPGVVCGLASGGLGSRVADYETLGDENQQLKQALNRAADENRRYRVNTARLEEELLRADGKVEVLLAELERPLGSRNQRLVNSARAEMKKCAVVRTLVQHRGRLQQTLARRERELETLKRTQAASAIAEMAAATEEYYRETQRLQCVLARQHLGLSSSVADALGETKDEHRRGVNSMSLQQEELAHIRQASSRGSERARGYSQVIGGGEGWGERAFVEGDMERRTLSRSNYPDVPDSISKRITLEVDGNGSQDPRGHSPDMEAINRGAMFPLSPNHPFRSQQSRQKRDRAIQKRIVAQEILDAEIMYAEEAKLPMQHHYRPASPVQRRPPPCTAQMAARTARAISDRREISSPWRSSPNTTKTRSNRQSIGKNTSKPPGGEGSLRPKETRKEVRKPTVAGAAGNAAIAIKARHGRRSRPLSAPSRRRNVEELSPQSINRKRPWGRSSHRTISSAGVSHDDGLTNTGTRCGGPAIYVTTVGNTSAGTPFTNGGGSFAKFEEKNTRDDDEQAQREQDRTDKCVRNGSEQPEDDRGTDCRGSGGSSATNKSGETPRAESRSSSEGFGGKGRSQCDMQSTSSHHPPSRLSAEGEDCSALNSDQNVGEILSGTASGCTTECHRENEAITLASPRRQEHWDRTGAHENNTGETSIHQEEKYDVEQCESACEGGEGGGRGAGGAGDRSDAASPYDGGPLPSSRHQDDHSGCQQSDHSESFDRLDSTTRKVVGSSEDSRAFSVSSGIERDDDQSECSVAGTTNRRRRKGHQSSGSCDGPESEPSRKELQSEGTASAALVSQSSDVSQLIVGESVVHGSRSSNHSIIDADVARDYSIVALRNTDGLERYATAINRTGESNHNLRKGNREEDQSPSVGRVVRSEAIGAAEGDYDDNTLDAAAAAAGGGGRGTMSPVIEKQQQQQQQGRRRRRPQSPRSACSGGDVHEPPATESQLSKVDGNDCHRVVGVLEGRGEEHNQTDQSSDIRRPLAGAEREVSSAGKEDQRGKQGEERVAIVGEMGREFRRERGSGDLAVGSERDADTTSSRGADEGFHDTPFERRRDNDGAEGNYSISSTGSTTSAAELVFNKEAMYGMGAVGPSAPAIDGVKAASVNRGSNEEYDIESSDGKRNSMPSRSDGNGVGGDAVEKRRKTSEAEFSAAIGDRAVESRGGEELGSQAGAEGEGEEYGDDFDDFED